MHYAIHSKDINLIKLLVEKFKIDVNIKNGFSKPTYLMCEKDSDIYNYLKNIINENDEKKNEDEEEKENLLLEKEIDEELK